MKFRGKAKRLDDIDLPKIGRLIGVGEDELHAVLDVETRGGGFDKQGRPKMLFEPHIFYRELKAHPAALKEAVNLGLAYRKWGTRKYPRDSYPRLLKAIALCERFGLSIRFALRSASWGLGQIMGFNHLLAGYPSARAMVLDFLDDEEKHLNAMVEFIRSAGLDDELRRHDWSGFARGYNGPGYAKHGYHKKLAAAFKKWQAIPDTPFQIDRQEPEEVRDTLAVHKKGAARDGAVAGVGLVLAAAYTWWGGIQTAIASKVCAIEFLNHLLCGGTTP